MKNIDITTTFGMIKRSYISYLNKKINNHDISPGEVPFIFVLNEKDKLTQKELSDSLRTSEGLATRVLKSLEQKEYITRKVDEKK